ncbi:MAG: NTP transferase domain-containing protein [Nitrospiraceae bacterium]|nr:NTP transferase domain-containing protein [Nitrospiraceae bacterium]
MNSAVILAAGEGARAWPFSGVRQKVTVPIVNVPMVRRLALDLQAVGIDDIVTVVGHRAEAVRACLADLTGVRFVEQRERTGPVAAALLGLEAISSDMVLVCCGDIVTSRETLADVVETFESRRAEALLLTAPCPPGLTASRMTVEVEPDGLVRGIYGRGGFDHPRFGGVAAAATDTLRRYLARDPGIVANVGVGSMPPAEGHLGYAFDLMRREGIEVHAVMAQDFLVDVDKPWHIVEANRKAAQHALDRLESTVIGEGASIDDGADIAVDAKLWLGPGARIGKGCLINGSAVLGAGAQVIGGAILGRDVTVGARTRCERYAQAGDGAVIGADCVLSHCAEFSGVMFDVVYLYHYCSLSALAGTHVDIGAATVCGTWRFDDSVKTQQVAGVKEKPECYGSMTYLGDYSRTGVNVTFMPGVKVGHYTCVGGGAIVYDDVPERTMLLPKQEHLLKPWGPEKYGW